MKKILAGTFGCMLLISVNVSAKEYLGFDLGNDPFEKVTQELERQKIAYKIEYEKDENNQEIKALPFLKFKTFPRWEKHGKVEEGELYFIEGKLATINASWVDIGDSVVDQTKNLFKSIAQKKTEDSLYKSLDVAFRKKYEIDKLPYVHNGAEIVRYSDDNKVDIRLKRSMVSPTRNPMDDYYVTSVTYWDKEAQNTRNKIVGENNKKIAEEKRKHDPDLQFAQDF